MARTVKVRQLQAMMDAEREADEREADEREADEREADELAERMADRAEGAIGVMASKSTLKATQSHETSEGGPGQRGRARGHRASTVIVDVAPDGIVEGVRPAEMTPDRGDVTHVHRVGEAAQDQNYIDFAGTRSDENAEGESEHLFSNPDASPCILIPSAAHFGTAPYIAAPGLERMAERLIDSKQALADLDGLRIVYRWKAKGGTRQGWPRLAGIERISGQTLAFIAGPAPDLLIWLAADTLRESAVDERQIEAILFDQLVSVEWSDGDEDGDPTWRLVGPEVMCHLATLEEYGAFTRKLEAAQSAFVQPSLFAAESEGERFSQQEAERVIAMAARAHAEQQDAD